MAYADAVTPSNNIKRYILRSVPSSLGRSFLKNKMDEFWFGTKCKISFIHQFLTVATHDFTFCTFSNLFYPFSELLEENVGLRRIESATESTSGGISAIATSSHQTVFEKVAAGDCTRKWEPGQERPICKLHQMLSWMFCSYFSDWNHCLLQTVYSMIFLVKAKYPPRWR